MFQNLRGYEWLIILGIIVLLFGVGRITKIGGELGSAIKSFRKSIKDDSEDKPKDEEPGESAKK